MMKRILLSLFVLWPMVAGAQSLQRLPGFRLCEPGATGSDCVTVGPMGAVTGAPACIPQSDSTPFDTCVTVGAAPTPMPTSTPAPTVTPIPTSTPYLGYDTIKEEGVALTQRRILNVVGAYVTCADDAPNTTCTVVTPTPAPTATPGAGAGDITDVWTCASGNCDALTAAAGDSLDAGSADSSKPATRSTSLPGTCAEGQLHQDTDSGGTETYVCTAANTWSRLTAESAALTSGRVPFVTTGGVLTDSANLTFSGVRLRGQNLTTADDNSTNMVQLSGTMPTTPSTTAEGVAIDITGAGSASVNAHAVSIDFIAGYTGPSATRALIALNRNLGTGTTLSLGATGTGTFDQGITGQVARASAGAGHTAGVVGEARDSTGVMVGGYFKANDNEAGTNYGAIASARNSTEATGAKDVGLLATLSTVEPTFGNISVALAADNGDQAHPIFNAYDNGSLVFSIADGGPVSTTSTFTSSRTSDLGWTKQAATNQACNTTCTSACVVGFDLVAGLLACSDATSDQCICAGSS